MTKMMMKPFRNLLKVLACVFALGSICFFSDAAKASGAWIWPFESRSLSRNFAGHGYTGVDVSVSSGSEIHAPADAKIVYIFVGCNHHSGLRYGIPCENAGECVSGNYSRDYDIDENGNKIGPSFTWGYCNHGFGNGIVLYIEEEDLTIQFAHMTSRT